jgi:Aspartyl/Asparaginyl beta-hydroxylase
VSKYIRWELRPSLIKINNTLFFVTAKNRFFKLPICFDTARLVQDLATCIRQDWTNHYNQQDYTGEWTGIALRSATGNAVDIYSHPDTEGYADTALLSQCPYFQEIINQFACEKEAIRLLALMPDSHIKEHRDIGLSYAYGVFRLHIPIITDDLVSFKVDGTCLKMDAGDCWYANFDLPHSVAHNGTNRRIHLVLDCKRNAWSDALFAQAGYDFGEEKRVKSPSITVKQQMIQQFESMNTDTARQLIAQLTKEIEAEKAQYTDGTSRHNWEGGKTESFSIHQLSPEWIPFQLQKKEDTWFAKWMYLDGKQFTEPFHADSLAKCKAHPLNVASFKKESGLKEMVEAAQNIDCVSPTAFIFHVSRCGSTLLSQLLVTDERNIVLSEAPLLDDVLTLNKKQPDMPQSEIDEALEAAIQLLGRKRIGLEERLFIKLDSWHGVYHQILRRLYPNTPFILLYRSPEEVFYSHQKQRGIQAVPGMVDPTLFGLKPDEIIGMDLDFYLGKVIESYFESFIKIVKTDEQAFLINYNEGVENMIKQFSDITNLQFEEETLAKMTQRSHYHAKHPNQVFEEQIPTKLIPEYVKKVFLLYQQLGEWAEKQKNTEGVNALNCLK